MRRSNLPVCRLVDCHGPVGPRNDMMILFYETERRLFYVIRYTH